MRNTRALAHSAICIALIAVCSWISIPLTVPLTLQTFGIFLTVCLLGARRAVAAVAVYILLGICGVPVFADFSGGIQIILGPTGGYIVGFIPAAAISGAIMKNGSTFRRVTGMCAGLVACYATGTAWFMGMYSGGGLISTLSLCVFPYIIPDILKIMLAAFIAARLDRISINIR